MKKLLKTGLAISALIIAQSGPSMAADGDGMNKLGASLQYVAKKAQKNALLSADAVGQILDKSDFGRGGPNNVIEVARVTSDGYVYVDAVASGDTNDLVVTIESLGGKDIASFGRTVSAKVPAERLADLASSEYLAFAKPVLAETQAGSVTSQGDVSMRSNLVRSSHGLDGEGMTIGVISDSFACNPGPSLIGAIYSTSQEDLEFGDITHEPIILKDYIESDCIDEGRGMAQLIQDVLPQAKIAFHTAWGGEATFAGGILELAKAGADVIVDDILYFAEPMFQDGIIAQAADQVVAWGIPYFSANGNYGRYAFGSEYRPINTRITNIEGVWHDFDPGPAVDTLASFTFGPLNGAPILSTMFVLDWDSPFFSVSGGRGAQNDVDIIMIDSFGRRIQECFDTDGNFILPVNNLCRIKQFDGGDEEVDGGLDAVELHTVIDFAGNSEIQIGLHTQSGEAPGLFKFALTRGEVFVDSEYGLGAPASYGHSNAAGVEGVGASAFFLTEEFNDDASTYDLRADAGEPVCVPACLNDFSSAGGTPILFDIEGNRLAEPEIRLKPGVTGPDGANTSFFGGDTSRDDDDGDGVFQIGEDGEYPNFFGTSASAPHVAALAGQLMNWEGYSSLAPTRDPRSPAVYNVCSLSGGSNSRANGTTSMIGADLVESRLEEGKILLRPCEATEPAELYQIIRDTAQDISIRANLDTGETIGTFPVTESGFDFDSGFGFVDAEAALELFTSSRGRTER